MTSRSQRTKKSIIRFDEDEILMRYEIDKKRRLNEQHEQSHKVRNTKSNLQSNPTRNKQIIKTANKLRTKQSIQNSNKKTNKARLLEQIHKTRSTITKRIQLYQTNSNQYSDSYDDNNNPIKLVCQ